MAIKRDNSSLPTNRAVDGNPPVLAPLVVPVLAERWFAKYQAEGQTEKAKALPARSFRASWAAKRCDRSLQYALNNVPASEPLTLADYWRFGLGTMVHEYLQETFVDLFPNTKCEVPVDLMTIGLDGSATVDMITYNPDGSVQYVVEIKTINGFGFKKSATAFKGPAEGPRWSAVVQGALAATALDAEGLIIAYLSLENLSPSIALSYGNGTTVGQFAAEWHYTNEEFAPIAAAEVERINRVMLMNGANVTVPRAIHDPEVTPGATVTDSSKGTWMVRNGDAIIGTGRTWMCDYCDHRSQCIADGEGGSSDSEVAF